MLLVHYLDNIEIRKTNPDDGSVIESEKVPWHMDQQKFLVRLGENNTRKAVITLPRLYFELVDVSVILLGRLVRFKN